MKNDAPADFPHLAFATLPSPAYFRAMPKLQINLPDGSLLDHELTDETVTVGRAPDNTFPLDDASLPLIAITCALDNGSP